MAVEIVSTRPPVSALMTHSWAIVAQQRTQYLMPLRWYAWLWLIPMVIFELLRSGPQAWVACWQAIDQADVSFRGKLRLLALLLMGAKLATLARHQGWSHIHVHSCADAANIALFAALLSGLSYSLTLHGPTLQVYGPNQVQKWRQAAFAIVVSPQLLQEVKTQLGHHLPPLTFWAPMGVDVDRIQRQTPYTPWQPGQVVRIFSCGRLNPVKGHIDLIEAIVQLRQRGWPVQLQIAGEDEQGGQGYRRELERLIQVKGLTRSVELWGAVPEERVRQGLEQAHLFALASLNEGIPVAVMEAMAMQTPVVVTEVGGNAELIDSTVNGLLVQPADPTAMATAIESLLQHPAIAQQFSQRSRQTITTQFHHHRSAEVLVDGLNKVGVMDTW